MITKHSRSNYIFKNNGLSRTWPKFDGFIRFYLKFVS